MEIKELHLKLNHEIVSMELSMPHIVNNPDVDAPTIAHIQYADWKRLRTIVNQLNDVLGIPEQYK